MLNGSCPRLSQAKHAFPLIRAHLAAAAERHLLPVSFSIELLPIVDEGIFGYEFFPNREANTYLTIGCSDSGRCVLRKSLYCAEAPSVLRLAAVNGRILSRSQLDAWHRIQPRDYVFPDWGSAAQAAWDELTELFPDRPRRSVDIRDVRHRGLDEAIAVAHALLAHEDPRIEFCGVPDEAQYGYALMGSQGEIGQLASRTAGRWTLRWESTGSVRSEQWSAALRDDEPGVAWASATATMGEAATPRPRFAAAISGAGSRPQ